MGLVYLSIKYTNRAIPVNSVKHSQKKFTKKDSQERLNIYKKNCALCHKHHIFMQPT